MSVVGEWRRQAVGAAGAGVLAPGAVVLAALTVGLGGGGVKGLDALGQAVTGPVIPDSRGAAGDDESRPDTDLLRRVSTRSRRPASTAKPARRRTSTDSSTATRGSGTPSSSRSTDTGDRTTKGSHDASRRKTSTTPSKGRGSTPAGTSTPQPEQPPQPTPTPEPRSPLRQIGDGVNEVVKQAPVVGPTAAQVVDGLVTAVDELPPKQNRASQQQPAATAPAAAPSDPVPGASELDLGNDAVP